MIRKSDIQWWVLEAKKEPETSPEIIEELAKRLIELDAENERLRNEIIRLQMGGIHHTSPAADSSAEVKALKRQVEKLQNLLEGEESDEPSLVLLSNRLQSARVLLSQAWQLVRRGNAVLDKRALLGLSGLLLVRSHEELLLLTSQGRGLKVQSADIPVKGDDSGGWPTTQGRGLLSDEGLTATITVGRAPRFWTIVTRQGYVQRYVRAAFDRLLAQGDQIVKSPLRNDVPVAIVNGDRGDMLLITRWGKGVRFSHRAIEGEGSVALNLDPDDEIIAALVLPNDMEILIVTAGGYAARRDTTGFAARSRPGGKGKRLVQAHDVLAVFPYTSDTHLLYLTYSGKLVSISTADIPLQERASRGVQMRDMSLDPAVAAVLFPQDFPQQ